MEQKKISGKLCQSVHQLHEPLLGKTHGSRLGMKLSRCVMLVQTEVVGAKSVAITLISSPSTLPTHWHGLHSSAYLLVGWDAEAQALS